MKKNIFIFVFGIICSIAIFCTVKQWEETKRMQEFQSKAQGHTAAIRAELDRIAQQANNVRFLIEHDINIEQDHPDEPDSFMPMVEPLLNQEAAFNNIAWGIIKPSSPSKLHIIYAQKEQPVTGDSCRIAVGVDYPHTQAAIAQQGDALIRAYSHHNEGFDNNSFQLIGFVADRLQDGNTFSGQQIGAVISEWNIATLVENALADMPVSAQDISLFLLADDGSKNKAYFHRSRSRHGDETTTDTGISYTTTFEFSGLNWEVTFDAAPQFTRDHPIILAWQMLALALLITLFFNWYAYRAQRHTLEVKAEVKLRTKELANSEEHFRRIVHNLQDVYYQTDAQGIITDVSPSVRMFGDTPEAAIGSQMADYYANPKGREKFLHDLMQSPHGRVYNYQLEAIRKDGRHIWISTNSQLMYDEQGEIIGVEGTLRDITDVRSTEIKLQHFDRVESLGVLAGGIAHDFNNILTAILGNVTLARMETDAHTTVQPYLDKIERASHSAANLCRQMLAYAGKGKYVVKPVSLSQIVDDMIQLIEVSIDKTVVIKYHLHEQLPVIDADIAQMQQLILNLITNASEAIEGKSGVIVISTGLMYADDDYLIGSIGDPHLEPGHYVYMEVSDTGCGMSAEMQSKIFDPFFTTKFTGRGLGMSAMRGIVKGHHGAMRIYSEEGKGTTIKVAFPISPKHAQAYTKTEQDTWQGSGTVLVIDDDENIREVASLMLENMGYDVITANDGQHGIEVFLEHQKDIVLVLLDMTMPVMNGSECFSKLRDIRADLPVILSSGYTEEDTVARFSGKKLSSFVQKPYSADALNEALKTAFKNSE